MSVDDPSDDTRPKDRSTSFVRIFLRFGFTCVLLGVAGWCAWVYGQIRYYAELDDARPAAAIAVFGAAEYDGRPSPVLRARLDHALDLYSRQIAPLIITLGGQGGDNHSEGGVGHDYLIGHAVPATQVIAETESHDTLESVRRLSVIAQTNHLSPIVVVSDDTHMFRIRSMCQRAGIVVYTSPRKQVRQLPFSDQVKRIWHEIGSYTLWRLLHI